MSDPHTKPGLTPQKARDKARREERSAAALRENLKRRKDLQRARAARAGGETDTPVKVDGEEG